MKSKTSTRPTLIVVALLGLALQPTYAAGSGSPAQTASAASLSFKTLDTDKDDYLSMKEFTATGLDDLAFRAADIDNDGRVDPGEYAKYNQSKASDPLKPGSGSVAPEPAPSPY